MGTVKEILYFDKSDKTNADEMTKFAKKRADELGIKNVVVVWSSGYTLTKFMEAAGDTKLNIVAVTNPSPHSETRGMMPIVIMDRDSAEVKKEKQALLDQGITERNSTISDETRAELEKRGIKVCYLNDWFNLGEPYALTDEWGGRRKIIERFGVGAHIRPLDIDAGADLSPYTTISQGVRVCIGCTVLAVKNGIIADGETVLALGGRCTALVLRAGKTAKTTIVKEIVGYERGSSHFERDPDHPEGD
ncbi:hypothetical protein ACFLTB_01020 [Chloroflexota bacterium]